MPSLKNSLPFAAAKAAVYVAKARVTNEKATERDDVPHSARAVTPEWLTAVLFDDLPGGAVTSVDVVDASSGTHDRKRLHLTYNDVAEKAGFPPTMFTKALPTITHRMISGVTGHAKIESGFYRYLRPELDIESPLAYFSAYDRNTMAGIHILEDMVATKSATFCDTDTYVTKEMVEQQIDLLAKVHSHFHDDPRLNADFRWVPHYHRWFTGGAEKVRHEHYTNKAFDEASYLIPDGFMRRRNEVWPATLRALEVHRSGPITFLHSDVHIGNWYQTAEGKMGLCDWQCASKGHWTRDFAYVVSAALTPEDRRNWERDLLERYLERQREYLGQADDFDQAWTNYRQQLLHALMMWTVTLCHSPLLPNMQPEHITLALIERMTTAIDDLDTLDTFD